MPKSRPEVRDNMLIERRKQRTARIGLFSVGHDTYWGQFDGLLDELMTYQETLKQMILENGVDVIDFGMVDNAFRSYEVVRQLKTANLDLIFCDMLTYATSSTWGIIQKELDIPIILVALQPQKAMDYAKASTYMQLVNDNICSLPEFVGVSVRMGKKIPPTIIGTLYDDPGARAEIAEWCRVACVLHAIRGARIGQMGHVLEAMLDMHTDPTAFTAQLGIHIVQLEPDDVMKHYRQVSPDEMELKSREILGFFDTPDPKSDPITERLKEEDLALAARTAAALDRFIEDKRLDGMAYYYEAEEGSEMRKVVTNFIVGNSLLCAAGFPMCGEMDLKTCVAMMIMDSLGIGGSFAEFHPIDFKEDFILVGHDGPHHINIADGKPVLRSLKKYHGKPGSGASVEFKIKEGPITMLGIGLKADGKFKFIIGEGESVEGLIPATGNTNTRGYFKPDAVTFLKKWLAEGPTHHFALGIGHHAATIKKIADTLGIEAVIVN
jgi:L-arabinose isomerase